MSIESMTGFARSEGALGGYSWSWEVRSVNARNLDTRLRLPPGLERLEPRLRRSVADRFRRGNMNASLSLSRVERVSELRVNREVLDQVLALAEELAERIEAAPPRIDGLLSVRGVLEPFEEEETEEERTALEEALLAGFADALAALAAARGEEGARLAAMVADHLDRIARLAAAARGCAESQPAELERRLRDQMTTLIETEPRLSEERLAQEVALLVARADVREEIDRLEAHVEAARALMTSGDAVGRRLDFLCQELNREANTLCSKASAIDLTRIGLDLKASVEQLREQIQNIE